MRPQMENKYVEKIDQKKVALEYRGQGFNTEEFVSRFYGTMPGFKARFSTEKEDMAGVNKI